MLFKQLVEVPANTAESSPVWEKLHVQKGTIIQWIVFSDPEAADLLHYRAKYHGTQIFPFIGVNWAEALLTPVPIVENLELKTAPYVIDIEAYNDDDTFEHEAWFYVNIVQEKAVELPQTSVNVIERFKALFGGGA